MKRRLTALLCAVVLLLGVVPAKAITEADVYFIALNINLLPLSAENTPLWEKGELYVPATVFDRNVTGMDMGVLVERSSAKNTLALYDLRQMLLFDLEDGSCTDHSNEPVDIKCVVRGGRVYVPLGPVCDMFGLRDSYTYTRYGYLIRICTESARLSDADFIDAASELMKSRAREYIESQRPVVTDKPPVPPVTPEDPVDVPPEQDQPKGRVHLYLGFLCRSGEGLEPILDALDRSGGKGVFFLTPELLAQQDDLVRRMVGSGHCVGLLAEGDDIPARLERGNRLLGHIARTAATCVWAPEEHSQQLQQAGWRCWQGTLDAGVRDKERPASYAQRMVNAIGTRSRSVYLTLDDSSATAGVLAAALDRFENEEYTVVTPIETRI